MTISVTNFKAHCLAIVRRLEQDRRPVEIKRRGRVVARLLPAEAVVGVTARPWELLRGSGELRAAPDESVLRESDFEAAR
jgi:antitoxin (DNA-binding transcriptional repressor) of toxin-antitoxin stability system